MAVFRRIKKSLKKIKLPSKNSPSIKKGGQFTFGFVLTIVVITALMLLAVSNSVMLNEITLEISDMESQKEELLKEQKRQEILLEKKLDLVAFEEYASYNLGMIKGEYTEVIGDSDRGDDVIEAYDGNYNEGGIIKSIFKALSDKFTESWNNLLR